MIWWRYPQYLERYLIHCRCLFVCLSNEWMKKWSSSGKLVAALGLRPHLAIHFPIYHKVVFTLACILVVDVSLCILPLHPRFQILRRSKGLCLLATVSLGTCVLGLVTEHVINKYILIVWTWENERGYLECDFWGRDWVGSALCGLIMYLFMRLNVYLSLQKVSGFILLSVCMCVIFHGHNSPVLLGSSWATK